MNDKDLIEEAAKVVPFVRKILDKGVADFIQRLADALEAKTGVKVDLDSAEGVEAQIAARQPSEDDREALARVMDTLAYYHCRSVNPKADHPHMGYHAMTEDQREHLREKQREAAEEIMRMIPSLSRAAVPDAATFYQRTIDDLVAKHATVGERLDSALALLNTHRCGEKNESIMASLVEAQAERDAARAAIERVRAIHVRTAFEDAPDKYHCKRCQVTAGTWPCPTVAALDRAPEPEWEYVIINGLGRGIYTAPTLAEAHKQVANDQSGEGPVPIRSIQRRRKAGPWLPVEGEGNATE